jgi:thiamine transport system substrate-binding protein
VLVVDGWEAAYTAEFSGASGSKGKRPIVVSYATSPAAEVIFAGKPPAHAPTAVVADSCFRQIELAGILNGTRNEMGAHKLIDFLLSERFQADVPGSMFVLPVRDGTPLPGAFTKYAVSPARPLELPPADIGANRDRWIDEWTRVVLR